MTYAEWLDSLDLPPGVGISTEEAYHAGVQATIDYVVKIWEDAKDEEEFLDKMSEEFGLLR